jgi:hypothetical protein
MFVGSHNSQGRANRFLFGGGCIPKFGLPSIPGPPPPQFFGKATIFRRILTTGGGYVFENQSSRKRYVSKIFRKTTFFQKFPKFLAKISFIF